MDSQYSIKISKHILVYIYTYMSHIHTILTIKLKKTFFSKYCAIIASYSLLICFYIAAHTLTGLTLHLISVYYVKADECFFVTNFLKTYKLPFI